MSVINVNFWGVRGSVPSPLTSKDVEKKVRAAIFQYVDENHLSIDDFIASQVQTRPFTYGGNTLCVEVRYQDNIFILDMGTGLRRLGNELFGKMMADKGLNISFIISHVHWDHIQGLPFFGPLYMNKASGIANQWHFYGGTTWRKTAESCLKGQMDPPTFPIYWEEIEKITEGIAFTDIHDAMIIPPSGSSPFIQFFKLNHPQETYGVRFIFPNGKILAYTTDNEPFDPCYPDPQLIKVAMDADLWITDCQYTQNEYNGITGISHRGWGHSYPEAVAQTAFVAKVKNLVTFHHDPGASDEKIEEIAEITQDEIKKMGGSCFVRASHEGMTYEL